MRHPARQVQYDDLIANLMAANQDGLVTVKADGPLRLFNYTDKCAFDKLWNEWTLMARGLVVDVEARQVVATPFPKFFNHGERPEPLPNEPFEVTEKMDGSLGIVFFHGGRWRCVTRGSFMSAQAQWAERWLHEDGIGYLDTLVPGHTYLFEIIYAENRIVVPYAFEGLVMLAAYDHEGYELSRFDVSGLAVSLAKSYEYQNLSDLLIVAEHLSHEREGFVVRFASGLRVKVKGAEYVRVHRLVSRVTPLGVYDLMVAGTDLQPVRVQLPEEFGKDFDTIRAIIDNRFASKIANVAAVAMQVSDWDDKTLGLWLKSQTETDPEIAKWIFPYRKHGWSDVLALGSTSRARFMASFRPTANKLEGYVPSTAMNRFSEEMG